MGMHLVRAGVRLSLWCENRTARRKWQRWAKKHKLTVTWGEVPEFNPYIFVPPAGDYVPVRPRPIVTLRSWED